MAGEEASFFILCERHRCLPSARHRDHKRVGDGDTGPNAPRRDGPCYGADADHSGCGDAAEIVRPTVAEMARRGMPFRKASGTPG